MRETVGFGRLHAPRLGRVHLRPWRFYLSPCRPASISSWLGVNMNFRGSPTSLLGHKRSRLPAFQESALVTSQSASSCLPALLSMPGSLSHGIVVSMSPVSFLAAHIYGRRVRAGRGLSVKDGFFSPGLSAVYTKVTLMNDGECHLFKRSSHFHRCGGGEMTDILTPLAPARLHYLVFTNSTS